MKYCVSQCVLWRRLITRNLICMYQLVADSYNNTITTFYQYDGIAILEVQYCSYHLAKPSYNVNVYLPFVPIDIL